MARREPPTDAEAAGQLRSAVLAACEGVKDVTNDRAYQRARKHFIGRSEYVDVLPDDVRVQRDVTALWFHLRDISSSRAERGATVAQTLKPLVDRAEGRTKPPVRSGQWTGRPRTVAQQAAIVFSIGPTAFQAVDLLLEEQEGAGHNREPGDDPERDEAIAKLRELHDALGELINLAKGSKPLSAQLKRVRAAKDALLSWSSETYELLMGQTPLMATSAVYGSSIWYLTNLLTRDLDASAAATAGILTMGAAMTATRKPKFTGEAH